MLELIIGAALMAGLPSMSLNTGLEDPEIEQSAREYRMQIYHSFRNNRPEYDSRWKQGQQVLQAWRKAGRPASLRDETIAWYSNASVASGLRQFSPLPPVPDFSSNQKPSVPATLFEPPQLQRLLTSKPLDLRREQVSVEPPQFNVQPTPVELQQELQVPRQTEGRLVFRSLARALWKAAQITSLNSKIRLEY